MKISAEVQDGGSPSLIVWTLCSSCSGFNLVLGLQ